MDASLHDRQYLPLAFDVQRWPVIRVADASGGWFDWGGLLQRVTEEHEGWLIWSGHQERS